MRGVPFGLALLIGCASGVMYAREDKGMDCTVTASPGAELQAEVGRLPAGAVMCLKPGRYRGGLRIERPLSLRALGDGGVVLDSEFQATVVHVAGDGVRVVLDGVTLTGGNGSKGGAIAVTGMGSEVVLRGCTIAHNRARTKWLGAVIAVLNDNRVLLERCRVEDIESDDESGPGQAMVVTQEGSAVWRDSLVVGRALKAGSLISVREGARMVIERSTLVNEGEGRLLEVFGTATDRPTVTVEDSILTGGEAICSESGAAVRVARSVLHGDIVGPVALGVEVRRADPAFDKGEPEPYRPSAVSPAVGLARGGGARDLSGRVRPDIGATAGAFER